MEEAVNVQISEFGFYSFISAQRGMISHILSHLNQSFACRAYSLYRRLGTTDMIDISVVLISEFVDDNNEENIKQLKDHYDEGYTKARKGMLKSVETDRQIEMFVEFPEVESTPISFKVDQLQLDSVGFAIDDFKEISVKYPANGSVKVHEVPLNESELLWDLSVCETETVNTCQQVQSVESTKPEDQPEVVYRTTRLTNREISRISTLIGEDWDRVAGLMDIPYSEREEIKMNHANDQESFSKAEKIFSLFNDREDFCRNALGKCFEELNLHDVKSEIRPVAKDEELEEELPSIPPDYPSEDETPLSPREMSRLSRKFSVSDSYNLADIMGISNNERENIRSNPIYSDGCSCAEKFLSIFNDRENFSRKALGDCLREIQKQDLIAPVITGEWRSL